MARGCIVVASDVGGLSEIMQGETSGLLCPVGDSMEIAKRVCLLLEQKSQLSNLSSGGREKASLFSSNIYQMQYSNLYHRILK